MNKPIKTAISYLFITLLGGLLYFHIYDFKFTYLDDATIVIGICRKVISDPLSILHIFTEGMFYSSQPQIYYRPVFDATFILNSVLGHNNLAAYYITNIFLHILASCLLFRLLTKLGYKDNASFLLSALFVVSPMAVQAVAWLPGRSDTLMAIFSISSFIAFMNFTQTTRPRYYFLHILLLLLAFFSKENALCLVIICFLYAHLVLGRKIFFTGERLLIAGWSAAVAGYFFLRHMALSNPLKITVHEIFTFMITNLFVIAQYVGRIFFPFNLSVWPTVRDSQWLPGSAAIIFLVLLLLFSKNIRPKFVTFGLSWFLLFLLPALIRPNAGVSAVFSNTRVYLSMVGILIILAETDMIKKADIKKWPHAIIVLLIIAFYSFIAFDHSYDFANDAAFWANARSTSPHSWIDPAEIKR